MFLLYTFSSHFTHIFLTISSKSHESCIPRLLYLSMTNDLSIVWLLLYGKNHVVFKYMPAYKQCRLFVQGTYFLLYGLLFRFAAKIILIILSNMFS